MVVFVVEVLMLVIGKVYFCVSVVVFGFLKVVISRFDVVGRLVLVMFLVVLFRVVMLVIIGGLFGLV